MPSVKQRDPDAELGKLATAIQQARLQLRWARQKRLDMVRQECGSHYFEDASSKTTPINLMSMASGIISRKLIPKAPRVMLSTFERQHRPAVSILEQWANDHIEKINLAMTLRRIVKDSLYACGIAKVSLATAGDAQMAGWAVQGGDPIIERIDLDDFVYDVHARDFSECGYVGHRFRLPVETVKKLYGVEATPDADPMFNLEGDERIEMIGRGYYSNEEEYEDFVDLWEVWLRREGLIVTMLANDVGGQIGTDDPKYTGISPNGRYGKGKRRAIKVQKWIGPECGPYHMLGLLWIPGNPMPKGPLHDCYDLHRAVNNICRKLIREAHDTKRITMFASGQADEDSKRLNQTPDGGGCAIHGDPKSIQQVVFNEPSQPLGVLMEMFIQRASWLMGNLDLIGGLGPQAKTATQDQLNAASSSANIGSYQDDTVNFTADVMKSWLWFEHHHPFKVHSVPYDLGHEGLPRIGIVRRSFPDNEPYRSEHRKIQQQSQGRMGLTLRSHDFDAMRIKVDPYSMQHQTPQQRAQMLMDAVRNVYIPMAQLAVQQGIGLDLNALFRKLGKYWDDPDLEEVFSYMKKPPDEAGQSGQSGMGAEESPAGSKEPTEIIRRSQGAESQQAKEALLSNLMKQGGNSNGQIQPAGAQ